LYVERRLNEVENDLRIRVFINLHCCYCIDVQSKVLFFNIILLLTVFSSLLFSIVLTVRDPPVFHSRIQSDAKAGSANGVVTAGRGLCVTCARVRGKSWTGATKGAEASRWLSRAKRACGMSLD
jgi:hypothetical protein